MKRTTFVWLVLFIGSSSLLGQGALFVGGTGFSTIQDAISSASNGDEIYVLDGVYQGPGNRDIDFGGKYLSLRSLNGPSQCVIDCQGTSTDPHRAFIIRASSRECLISGFTVLNGWVQPLPEQETHWAWGGAILCTDSSPRIENCIFVGNRAQRGAAVAAVALAEARTGPIVSNCSFVGNWAFEYGGALYCGQSVWIDLMQSILWLNLGGEGSALAIGTGKDTRLSIAHCDVGGGVSSAYTEPAPQPGTLLWQDTNIDIDPCFVDTGYWDTRATPNDVNDDVWIEGNYHLMSKTGRFDPRTGAWVQDFLSSPCIDAGPSRRQGDLELWPHGQRSNLGAYGNTAEASLSPSNIGVGDLNGDGLVRYDDLSDFLEDWLHGSAFSPSDLNHDNAVDLQDLALLLAHWRMESLPDVPPQPDADPVTWAADPNQVFMTWAQEPNLAHVCGSTATMIADTFYATDGTAVEYLFRDLDNIHLDSGWMSFLVGQQPQWSVSGLLPGEDGQPREYRYEVKARNLGNGLGTEWSNWAAVYPISSYFTPAYAAWEAEPNLIAGVISMKAREVTDSCGLAVEYFFSCSDPILSSPDWQADRAYSVDVTQAPRTVYAFSVQARNSEGKTSERSSPLVWVDLSCKLSPAVTQWETVPSGRAKGPSGTISMKAQEVTDSCGGTVEYWFSCADDPQLSSQAWQESREYNLKDVPLGQYSFSVQARNAEGVTNEPSEFVTADLTPPTPNPPKWAQGGLPIAVNHGAGSLDWWYEMTASEVVDNDLDGQVQYFFRCKDDSRFNSAWQLSPSYTVKIGPYKIWTWFVKARDQHGNETGWSEFPYEQQ